MRSKDMKKPNDAILEIAGMKTPAEITAFTDGDKREAVLDAANARLKELLTAPPAKKAPATAPHTTCMYHREQGSRLFKTGDIIPEGYRDEPFPKE